MASISAFGIVCAALIGASESSRALDSPKLPVADALTDVTVEIDHVRSRRGVVRLCLTARSDHFPSCQAGDHFATVKADAQRLTYAFRNVRPGIYAVAAFHDADSDGRLDTLMGIPTEGFAFSRNPKLRPRAPRFDEVRFSTSTPTQRLQMRYLT